MVKTHHSSIPSTNSQNIYIYIYIYYIYIYFFFFFKEKHPNTSKQIYYSKLINIKYIYIIKTKNNKRNI